MGMVLFDELVRDALILYCVVGCGDRIGNDSI